MNNPLQIIENKKPDLDRILAYFKEGVASIRTGRASIGMVENLKVEAYGSSMSLKEVAALSVPEPRTIQIQPWDKTLFSAIEEAIKKSGLGLNPAVDSSAIRLIIPPLLEERRKEFIKLLHQKAEEVRISIRRVRDELIHKLQSMEKLGEIREDEKFKAKEKIQESIDNLNQKIEEILKRKEEELAA